MNGSVVTIIVITLVVVLLCCLCVVVVSAGGVLFGALMISEGFDPSWYFGPPTATPVVIRPDAQPVHEPTLQPTEKISGDIDIEEQPTATPMDTPPVEEPPVDLEYDQPIVPHDTLEILEHTNIPANDLLELAYRLEGIADIPRTLEPSAVPLQVGDQDTFWVTNTDTDESFEIGATLQYVTDHAYFWFENGVVFSQRELMELAETFESKIYPTNRAFFGSEWTPGVDGDPHLYIIFATDLGFSLAGYFSTTDEYHPLAHEYSNAHETFMMNFDNLNLDDEFTYAVLAHEFQHMIHWNRDRNESSWLNEGFSELAAFLNDYDVGGFDHLFAIEPDLQLNDWPNDPSKTPPHYGAAFLFVAYFLDRFGDTTTQALVGHPVNGMTSVDVVLTELGVTDPLTGETLGADDVFIDWALASYLHDSGIADGRYAYQGYEDAPQVWETESIHRCPTDLLTRDVHQYAADYIRFTCPGDYTLRFEGSIQVGVIPGGAFSGDFAYWSNKGDESDMTLTRDFDFSEQDSPLTLTYWTWYDLETDYDYVYLEASTDGERWQILTTPSGTAEDPSGNNYGWGYTGLSGGDGIWIQEQVDLSVFAGQQVQIRFEYVTDAAVNGEGFLLDDIAVPEIGYFSDFEMDDGGWDAAGFVRIQNILPQTFRLALISRGDTTQVEYITLNPDNALDIPLHIGNGVDEVTLVVTGTTRHTRQKAAYRFEVIP
jgi:immune inhibitor A